jgi:polyisoprenoid-binding protein YceI
MTKNGKRWLWIAIGAVVVVLLGVVVAPFVYIHFIEPDPAPKLDISTTAPPTTAGGASATRAPLTGTWNVVDGSKGQYRVEETLFGQDATATGTSDKVSGSMTIDGTTVETAKFTVDLTALSSDRSNRDAQVQGRILNTSQFPDATFTLTKPIELGQEPADGAEITAQATGDFTVHGTTKNVTIDLKARRTGNTIEVSGSLPITFSDYGIDNPSGGPAQVGDTGAMEFLLELNPAS